MSNSPSRRRIRPTRCLVLGGLALTLMAGWGDRGFFRAIALMARARSLSAEQVWMHLERFSGWHETPRAAPEAAPGLRKTQELRQALWAWQEGLETYQNAIQKDWTKQTGDKDLPHPETLDEHKEWPTYRKIRDAHWPAHAKTIKTFVQRAKTLQLEDSGNGVYTALAGLMQLRLALRPSPSDPVWNWDMEAEDSAKRIEVSSPADLKEALALIDEGLGKSRFSFNTSRFMKALAEAEEGLPLERLGRRIHASCSVFMPELMAYKSGVVALGLLARQQRQRGLPSEHLLSKARKLGLRQGAEAGNIIELLVAMACVNVAQEVWLLEATAQGDFGRVRRLDYEKTLLHKLKNDARRLPRNQSENRWGAFDSLLAPSGGWGDKWDASIGRRLDYAMTESVVLWALMLFALCNLLISWRLSRYPPPEPPLAASGWTLGDLLGVVLRSSGAALALFLCFSRLHPSHELALFTTQGAALAFGAQVCGLILCWAFLESWLLRRTVLRKHRLGWLRPARAKAALGLIFAGTGVCFFWVGPLNQDLLPLAGVLFAAGLVSAALSREWQPEKAGGLRAPILRYQGRVGLACWGAALCLIASVNLLAVTPRRDSLVGQAEAQYLHLFQNEANNWGNGATKETMRDLLTNAPDAPKFADGS